jgi:DNA-binding transcriptional regulator of glucitol operon
MSKQKKIVSILVILVLVAAVGGWYAYSEYNRPLANMTETKAAVTIGAINLISAFEKDPTNANQQYIDKIIEVEGILKEATADDQGLYTLALGEESSMSSVRCSIDSASTQAASQLKKGDPVKIKGVCSGFTAEELLGSDVTLVRCAINN